MSDIQIELNLKRAHNDAQLLESNTYDLVDNFEFIKSDLTSRNTDSFYD